ncbi:MAG: Hsp20/alpha crystallin family protein [Chitinispirillaceae bacterium]
MAEASRREQKPVQSASAEQLVSPENAFSPDVNIYDNREALIISMDMPGVKKGNVNIEVDENKVMSVRAKSSFQAPEGTSLVQEFTPGDFYRSFTLSNEFITDKISGKLENGVLEVIIPRREDVKPRRIEISA